MALMNFYSNWLDVITYIFCYSKLRWAIISNSIQQIFLLYMPAYNQFGMPTNCWRTVHLCSRAGVVSWSGLKKDVFINWRMRQLRGLGNYILILRNTLNRGPSERTGLPDKKVFLMRSHLEGYALLL